MARYKKHLDETAFERIVSDFTPSAAALARQMLRDPVSAEDAVQEAFVRVIHKRRQYAPSRPFSYWFYAMLRNICIDMLRRRKREKEAVQHLTRRIQCYIRNEPPSDCVSLLRTLPLHERSVLELRVVHSMTFEEIAIALDISTEAAKKRAQRGLRKLRKQMEQSERVHRRAV
ncbi:MAG: RNA polymerase sigma factor [Sedimentisphaerales bacterium]|nr:RNA polymerase sigma factor [Sedimentisphaerales bacterium]